MKSKFNTFDICATVSELQKKILGLRLVNAYDVDHKTYLLKLAQADDKAVVLIESGCRIHLTEFDWPKNLMPSSFSMKLRKHLRTKRVTAVRQLGIDRIIDFQFGSAEHTFHIICELYDRGNVVLADHEYMILNILRPRTDQKEEIRFSVKEKYPVESARQLETPDKERIREILSNSDKSNRLKRICNLNFPYGAPLLEHCFNTIGGLKDNMKMSEFELDGDVFEKFFDAIQGPYFI